MKPTKLLILVIIMGLFSTPAFSQQLRGAGPGDGRQEREFAPDREQEESPSDERREEVRKKIEAIRIWRMTEELHLDAATSGKLSSLLSSIEQKRREVHREQRESMRTLREMLKSQKPDEGNIRQLLDKLEKNHLAMQELKNVELKGLKDILTIEQRARFLVFQQEFQREMRHMISGARGRTGMRGMDPAAGNRLNRDDNR